MPAKKRRWLNASGVSVFPEPSGDEEIRTLDLLHAMQALYQLSYVPERDPRLFPGPEIVEPRDAGSRLRPAL